MKLATKSRNGVALVAAASLVLSLAYWVLNKSSGDAVVEALRIINTAEERNSREPIEAVETLVSRGVDLIKMNLSNANLAGLRAANADLPQARFVRSSLVRADLTRAVLAGAQFNNSELMKADITSVNLGGAIFSGADLIGAIFSGANLAGADFTGAILTDADFLDASGLNDVQFFDACVNSETILSTKFDLNYCAEPKGEE